MEPIDIMEYRLPTPVLKSLLTLVEIAERNQVTSLFYTWQQSGEESGAFDLMIEDREKGEHVIVPRLREDPIAILEDPGYVRRLGKNRVLLRPEAFERARYERTRSRSGKMTRTRTIKFTDGKWLPVRGTRFDYELRYSVVDTDFVGTPDEMSHTEYGSIVVGISMVLATAWGLSDESSREKVLFEFAKQHIKEKVSNNTLNEREVLQLATSTAPKECPFDPNRIKVSFYEPFEFPVADELETVIEPTEGEKPAVRPRRPGYDHIYNLFQQYEEIPPQQRTQIQESEVSNAYVEPMFQALGWDVWVAPPPELELAYRDLRVPVEVKGFGDSLNFDASSLQRWRGVSTWGILTNFETVHVWDLDRQSLILESSPWSYVADDREEDDLLAAHIFYERLVQPPSKELPSERIEIATRALADTWSKVDLLEFSDYAEALADFIKNEKTGKPLTIGIDAAWGMGKTTLLHMIKDQMVQQEERTKGKGTFPTVWFNAWRYDQEESLWAALALEILSQVRGRFNWLQRIEFWLKLNWERFDRELLLHSGLKLLAYLLTIILLGVLVFGIATLWLGTTLPESIQRLWTYVTVTGALGFIGALYAVGKDVYSRLIGPFDLKIAQYIREPNYRERVGFLAEFEEDFERVIDIVTEKGKWPLIVFIDDLDRCAPPTPAEIVEAINILLDAKHCVFVIGMDARTVAGSIEAKYKDLKDYLDDADDPGGLTLGQRFLEKIVQISFHIPKADPKVVNSFVDANLKALKEKPSEEPSKEEVKEAEQLIEVEQKAGKALDEAAQAVQAARPDIPMEVVAKAKEEVFAKSFDDSEDVQRAIHDAAPYLGFNPRKIKRFINIFRLHALIANRRGLLETGVTPLDLLAKCVIIAMRCPDMVEEIMTDQGFVNRLKQARQIKDRLLESEYGPEQEQRDRTSLGNLLTDPRIERLIDATDLIALLEDMTTEEFEGLPYCLHLVEITSNGRGS
jgi:hypothetical protein